ncbi:MAG: DUF3300 domain-containing protein, partial [Acetobacteraceae bacterium]
PQVVYLPVYNPTVAYGTWPYPTVPPVYFPPPGYVAANALVSGLAFATGVAVVGSLWGWSRPAWGANNVNVNVNRWNSINVNRTAIHSNVWRPPPAGVGGRPIRPPGGPVGAPARLNGLPANAIGRQSVHVSPALVSRPAPGGTLGQGIGRPGPAAGQGNLASRAPARPPAAPAAPATANGRGGAFAGLNEGARASQYGTRGAQSRSFQAVERGGSRPAAGRGGRR